MIVAAANVEDFIYVDSLEVSAGEAVTGNAVELTAVLLPANATCKDYTVTSSDESIIQVTDNVTTAVAAGSADLTVIAVGSKDESVSPTVTVTVTDAATGDESGTPDTPAAPSGPIPILPVRVLLILPSIPQTPAVPATLVVPAAALAPLVGRPAEAVLVQILFLI